MTALGYDAKGNIVSDGSYGYAYSSENLLTSLTNPAGSSETAAAFGYDPLMRLASQDSTNSLLDAQLAYDGQEMVYEAISGSRSRRYVFGPGGDEPLVAYLVTAAGTTRYWYHSDERGTILRQTDDLAAPAAAVGRLDEYGSGIGTSRFHFTGQYWLGDSDLHYFRARILDARLGRFLQPDPIGYQGGMNLYAYVGGDPVNLADPLGLLEGDIIVTGQKYFEYADVTLTGLTFDPMANPLDWLSAAAYEPQLGLVLAAGSSACLPHVGNFVKEHLGDAQRLASATGDLGVTAQEILAWSGDESQWGTSKIAGYGNFFGLHSRGGGSFPGQTGTYHTTGRPSVAVPMFARDGFVFSGAASLLRVIPGLRGLDASNPTVFFGVANDRGWAAGTARSAYIKRMLMIMKTAGNCME